MPTPFAPPVTNAVRLRILHVLPSSGGPSRPRDRIAEQEAEGALVLLVLGQIGPRPRISLRAILDPLAELAMGHDVELVVEDPLQHPLADLFLRAERGEEITGPAGALSLVGIAGIWRVPPSGLGRLRRMFDCTAPGQKAEQTNAVRLELGTHASIMLTRRPLEVPRAWHPDCGTSPDIEAVLTMCPPSPLPHDARRRMTMPLTVLRQD